ncbi:PREDICTED: serine beta-lactamase-like protein LACTB, mitochondrial [Priapulus caudatus]|uniref:Serine beta-lactamase-like protein LACTB, mitochondrial n=1 Tax=Priapulus caudatus TaxID=37621 RepID=A0ABM1EYZ8_PRICU|nr:PREDICTED: serine beta-lactamase-like protein LACTB, mitochondrial [Priapulus caudatus]
MAMILNSTMSMLRQVRALKSFGRSCISSVPKQILTGQNNTKYQSIRLVRLGVGHGRMLPRPLYLVGAGIAAASVTVYWQCVRDKTNTLCEAKHMNNEAVEEEPEIPRSAGLRLAEAVEKSKDIARRIKDEVGAPGLVVAVGLNGKLVWVEGFGYSDVENRVQCHPDTVMRIASISKSITMTDVARLVEEGKLDLDAPLQKYVKDFPEKTYNKQKVTITTRMLASHMSGIRHYEKELLENDKAKRTKKCTRRLGKFYRQRKVQSKKFLYTTHGYTLISAVVEGASGQKFTRRLKRLFDDLGMSNTQVDKPGHLIYHRSHYYRKNERGRLVNAPYVDLSSKWAGGGIVSTAPDLIAFGTAMLYSHQHRPCPACDRGAQTTGGAAGTTGGAAATTGGDAGTIGGAAGTTGGAVATTGCATATTGGAADTTGGATDTTGGAAGKTGGAAVDTATRRCLPGYLSHETVEDLWRPLEPASGGRPWRYAMGWDVVAIDQTRAHCRKECRAYLHTGGAVGASTALVILPRRSADDAGGSICERNRQLPRGVVVAMIMNMQSVSLARAAVRIGEAFEQVEEN